MANQKGNEEEKKPFEIFQIFQCVSWGRFWDINFNHFWLSFFLYKFNFPIFSFFCLAHCHDHTQHPKEKLEIQIMFSWTFDIFENTFENI